MIVDGKAIRDAIKENLKKEVGERKSPPVLSLIIVGENPVSERYLSIKKKFGKDIGVSVREVRFPNTVTEAVLKDKIKEQVEKGGGGIVVQLPLPEHLDTSRILNILPPSHDPDVLGEQATLLYEKGETKIVPPVIGAIKEILLKHGVFVANKNVVIVGQGKLVGEPATVWFNRHGAEVTTIDKNTPHPEQIIKEADIIVSGVGKPGIITPEMIKDGVVILDAGTSEQDGKLLGDADPECAKKATIFTPTPGGIGPITVAILFKNFLELTKEN